jgi:hypothetical protein
MLLCKYIETKLVLVNVNVTVNFHLAQLNTLLKGFSHLHKTNIISFLCISTTDFCNNFCINCLQVA